MRTNTIALSFYCDDQGITCKSAGLTGETLDSILKDGWRLITFNAPEVLPGPAVAILQCDVPDENPTSL